MAMEHGGFAAIEGERAKGIAVVLAELVERGGGVIAAPEVLRELRKTDVFNDLERLDQNHDPGSERHAD